MSYFPTALPLLEPLVIDVSQSPVEDELASLAAAEARHEAALSALTNAAKDVTPLGVRPSTETEAEHAAAPGAPAED